MPKNRFIQTIALAVLLISLLSGVIHLFVLRFQTGDIYPAYSSLRSDPLGTRALHDSLMQLQEFEVQRNFNFLHSLKVGPDTVLLHLGSDIPGYDLISEKVSQDLDRLTESGGRLVISYVPVNAKNEFLPHHGKDDSGPDCRVTEANGKQSPRHQAPEEKLTRDPESEADRLNDNPEEKDRPKDRFVSIKEHWGFGFSYNHELFDKHKDEKYLTLDAVARQPDLPAVVSWHTNLYFELFDDSWQTLYAADERPVIIERQWGRGTLVLCADSYFFSNEALRAERHPQLLVRLIGEHSKIIFDESHFGIYKHPGVARLLRTYGFQWFMVSLALVALLFVWKNTVYFIPPGQDHEASQADVVSEKDYAQGLIALLRRNVNTRNVLRVCGQEWEQSFKKDKRTVPAAIDQMKAILQTGSTAAGKKSNPVSDYRKICSIFKRYGIFS